MSGLKSPFAILAESLIKRPYFFAGILVALFFICAFFATGLSMDTGTNTFIYEDSKEGTILDSYSDTFLSDAIILVTETDCVYSPQFLKYLELLGEDIRNERYVLSVTTPADIIKSANQGVIPNTETGIKAVAAKLPDNIRETYFESNLLTITTVRLEPGLSDETTFDFIANLETLTALSDPPAGVKVSVSGESAFSRQMQQEMGNSMRSQIALTMILMIAALAFLFSYVRYRFLPIVVIAFGVVVTFGIMVMAGLPVSMPVIGSFPVIIGLGIDYAVQFHSRFNEEVFDKSVPDAVYAMLTKAGPVHLVAMCTTMIGFLALLFTPIPMIAQFGSACIIGVVSSFAIALILLPVFFLIKGYNSKDFCSRCENNASKKSRGVSLMRKYDRFLGNFAEKVARHAVFVILIFAFIAVVGINFSNDVGINVDRSTFVPSDMPAKIYNDKVKNLIGSPTTFPVLISGDYITSPDVLEWSDSFSEYTMQKHQEITGYKSITTLIKQYNDGILPKTAAEAKYILSGIPDENKDRYLDGNIRSVIEFQTTDIDMKGYSSLLSGINDDIAWYAPPPGITAVPTGLGQLNGYFYENIMSSQSLMTIAALLMIFIFMLLVYRRFLSLAPMIPVIMIVGWNALIMYVLKIEYTPLTACLGSMTIGLAMDYTILIMERCEEEMDKGEDLYFAIRTGVQKIGSAITISGVTTLLGFSAMITSDFSLVSMFGQTTVITIFFSLVGGIVVMPAVVALVYRGRIKNTGNKSKIIPDKIVTSEISGLG